MAENFTIEFTRNATDGYCILSEDQIAQLGEYIYVGILMYDGTDRGVLYAQKNRTRYLDKYSGVVYYDWKTNDGWIGMVIFSDYQTV